jgi:hypothetical protein
MVTNWYDETEKELLNGDHMQKSYHVELNGHMGYLTLTDERLIFMRARIKHARLRWTESGV